MGVVALVLATALAACGGRGGDPGGRASRTNAGRSTGPPPLLVVLTNDDGYAATGLAALARALEAEPRVTVRIVAPRDDQTGRGGATTPGAVAHERVRTPEGRPAVAVAGYPADTVRVALDDLGLDPDLVVSGINAGQNLGPIVEVSGTVGAARAAASRGLPAVAVSQGLGRPPDYPAGVKVFRRWFRSHRRSLARLAGTAVSINVPTCTAGAVRGTVEVPLATEVGRGYEPVDCRTGAPAGGDDVGAFTAGFATVTRLPPANR